jgi:phosphoribosylaminoimidazole carboxylase
MGHITIVGSSDAEVRARLRPVLLQLRVDEKSEINDVLAPIPQHPRDLSYEEILKAKGADFSSGSNVKKSSKYPLVGIIMGSDSDLPVMRDAAGILDGFGVEYELTIVSAHRTPERLVSYANSAVSFSFHSTTTFVMFWVIGRRTSLGLPPRFWSSLPCLPFL